MVLETSRGHGGDGDKPQSLALARATIMAHWRPQPRHSPGVDMAVWMQAAGSAWRFLQVGGDSSLTGRICALVRTLSCQVKKAGWHQECQQKGCKSKNPHPPLYRRRGRPEVMFNQGRAGIPMEEKTRKLFLHLQMLTERTAEP